MGKCTSSSLRKGHRIKCQCTTGTGNPWAIAAQFNLNPGQTVKAETQFAVTHRYMTKISADFLFSPPQRFQKRA